MLIKCKFLKNGEPAGRDYTYKSTENVAKGDKVLLPGGGRGIVVMVNVPESEVEAFNDKIKYIEGRETADEAKEI